MVEGYGTLRVIVSLRIIALQAEAQLKVRDLDVWEKEEGAHWGLKSSTEMRVLKMGDKLLNRMTTTCAS